MKEVMLASNDTIEVHSPNTVFFCPEESQFYAQCLEKMVLPQCGSEDSVVEFGAGDGSPVISALLKSNFKGFIEGFELNAAACKLANSRIQQYDLDEQYSIYNQCFFKNAPESAKYLVANPPYLPAPNDDLYMPSLYGGRDGATITKRLLNKGCENVMLMISAYSNPIDTVDHALKLGYQVVDFMVSPLRFGYYSCEPKVKNTITELQRQQKAFFSENIYFLAGVLFEKKNFKNTCLSTELIKVMTAL
ncbi:MAG TPA: methyltransferase [Leptolyngbyaceae cyanobacterium]